MKTASRRTPLTSCINRSRHHFDAGVRRDRSTKLPSQSANGERRSINQWFGDRPAIHSYAGVCGGQSVSRSVASFVRQYARSMDRLLADGMMVSGIVANIARLKMNETQGNTRLYFYECVYSTVFMFICPRRAVVPLP